MNSVKMHLKENRNDAVTGQRDRSAPGSARPEVHGSIYIPSVQRKACCACGGGCPCCAGVIQPKLKIGQPNDFYEYEADRIADQVTRMPEPVDSSQPPSCGADEIVQTKPLKITPLIQRQTEEEEEVQTKPPPEATGLNLQRQIEEDEETVQVKAYPNQFGDVQPDLESKIRAMRGGGELLPKSIRAFFEPRFGYDFSHVRVHREAQAAETSKALNSRAFTVGNDIMFGAGQYAPETTQGRSLLAHELTHVIQQANASYAKSGHIQAKPEEPQKEKFDPKVIEEALKSQYPHIYKILSNKQRKAIVNVFLYRKKLSDVELQLSKLGHTAPEGSWHLTEDEPEIGTLEKRSYRLQDFISRNWRLQLNTAKLLDAGSFELDKSSKGDEADELVRGYKRLLYMTVSSQPTILEIQDVDPKKYVFQAFKLIWGKNEWVLPNDGGRVTFKDLMRIESFNVEYQEVLLKGQLRFVEQMEKLAATVKLGPRRSPDDPIVLAMSKKDKLMKALSYSKGHFSAKDAAERVFGRTPSQIALNIGIMIGTIIALAIIGSLGPIGALVAGGIAATLVIIFGLQTIKKTISALSDLYSNATSARNEQDLNDAGKQFAQEGGEAALMILLFIVSGKIVKRFVRKGRVGRGEPEKSPLSEKIREEVTGKEPSKATIEGPETEPSPAGRVISFQGVIDSIFNKLGGNKTGYKISICDDTTVIYGKNRTVSNIGISTKFWGGGMTDPPTNTIWIHELLVRNNGLVRQWGGKLNLTQVIAHEIGHAKSGSFDCHIASRFGADLPGLTKVERLGLLDDAVNIAKALKASLTDLNLPSDYTPH